MIVSCYRLTFTNLNKARRMEIFFSNFLIVTLYLTTISINLEKLVFSYPRGLSRISRFFVFPLDLSTSWLNWNSDKRAWWRPAELMHLFEVARIQRQWSGGRHPQGTSRFRSFDRRIRFSFLPRLARVHLFTPCAEWISCVLDCANLLQDKAIGGQRRARFIR